MNLTSLRTAAVAAGLAAAISVTPGYTAQADLDLIQSYVGDWRGSGSMQQTGQPTESVRCRMDVTKSTDEKVNINGACSIAGGRLNMYGTLAYINGRYEAVINTAAFDQITAVGRRRGSSVSFDFRAADSDGNNSNISAGFGLSGDTINVNFTVRNEDGSRMTANVPLDRQ